MDVIESKFFCIKNSYIIDMAINGYNIQVKFYKTSKENCCIEIFEQENGRKNITNDNDINLVIQWKIYDKILFKYKLNTKKIIRGQFIENYGLFGKEVKIILSQEKMDIIPKKCVNKINEISSNLNIKYS